MSDTPTPSPIAAVAFLSRSETRVRVLEYLFEVGPATQRDLRDHLDSSRSTVTRALASLEERDWITQEGRTYVITPIGEVITESFLDLLDSIRLTDELSAFLRWFPLSDSDIDVTALRDATIITATDGDPYAPARAQTQLLGGVQRFRGLFPSIDLEGTRFVHDRIIDDGLEAEIIVSDSVEATITSGEFASLFREQIRTGRLTVRVEPASVPFYLGLGDQGTVHIGVEDDEGYPRALLETDNPRVREWAEDRYAAFRDESRVKSADGF